MNDLQPIVEEPASDEEFDDDFESPLAAMQLPVAAAPDGLPDPLGAISEMLPGGRATRGKPSLVYVPTQLDTGLVGALHSLGPTLVVLSGNAGDGKTAFLAEIIERSGGEYEPGVKNEYDLEIGPGKPYRVVLDGSEDAEDRSNDALLDDALRPFMGDIAIHEAPRGTLIAINKGRLLKFLHLRRDDYAYLSNLVASAFLGGSLEETPYILIDLNDRTFVGPDPQSSLMIQVLDRLVTWWGWDECLQCPAVQTCPAIANVRLLRAPDAGYQTPRHRLWDIFAAADLDDRVHITARHVVTQLARLIGAGRRCFDIRAQAADDRPFESDSYLYNSLVVSVEGSALGESSELDAVLATYDPSERDEPLRDRLLHAHIAAGDLEAVLPNAEGAHESYLDIEAQELADQRVDREPPRGSPDYRQRTIQLSRALQRKLYMEGSSDLAPDFPLLTMHNFLTTVGSGDQRAAVRALIANLNAALGVEGKSVPELLSPREYARGLRGRGFAMLIPQSHLSIVSGTALGAAYRPHEFLETWPRSILLRAHDSEAGETGALVATLSIPLLLFEILERAGRGFRPSGQTERAYVVRLRGFYRQLSEYPWRITPSYALYDNGQVVGKAKLSGRGFTLMGD